MISVSALAESLAQMLRQVHSTAWCHIIAQILTFHKQEVWILHNILMSLVKLVHFCMGNKEAEVTTEIHYTPLAKCAKLGC